MSIISVEGKSLGAELAVWGVPHNYALAFAEKSTSKNGRIALHPFFFNDTEHMTNPRHWLAINAAFWCCVYREAESKEEQIEALAGIRAIFYTAGALGVGEIKALIQEWWRTTYELHLIPAPNYSAATVHPTFH
ncbi:hypothetical protein ACLHOE_003377 [Salmonella enterica subsp. enterica serovar Newport]|uniref:Phage protein n=2 Tax=Salmonella enterica subsp. enterica serovar Stanley TaxID=192953 RepID=A0A730AF32_SALET|nr:hypothetical protein [Salmonella enterica]EAA1840748.1 hypothetical protein [Salmonella enterica subsp. enterica serovar Stanleyville]EAA6927700.1 hypothetical protein [Salmonella enterica subsp. enterica serovar Stanley]EBR8246854.1 hypothetical protein [Salmonella enterica subsp. enterica serovar Shubra]ECA9251571.1 hypothetical protein [Salmonella enterica subsp. enterica serovar Muenster]ECB3742666.1 hypothetical protein [Salmonella enterica subsp. enterica serovar Akanji]ECE0718012.1 